MRETDFLLVASDIFLHGHSLTINIGYKLRSFISTSSASQRITGAGTGKGGKRERKGVAGAPPSKWIGATFQNIFVAPPLNLTGATFQNFFVAPPFNLVGATAQFCRPSPKKYEGLRGPNWG